MKGRMRFNLKETGCKVWSLHPSGSVHESVVGHYKHNDEPLDPAYGIGYPIVL
jgi:hypothetical protein